MGRAAFGTMRHADRGVKKTKIIVDFGNGTHGRSGTAAGGLLLDRDRRAQAVDGINIRTFHLIQELAGVGGQGFDVAALALGIDGVEGERRFARTAEAGNHGQGVPGNLYINILEVMLARPSHRNLGDGHQNRQ